MSEHLVIYCFTLLFCKVAVHIVKRTFDDIFHEFEHGKNNDRPLKEGPPEGVERRTYGKLKTIYDLIIKGKEKGLPIERLEEKLRGFPNLNMINKVMTRVGSSREQSKNNVNKKWMIYKRKTIKLNVV
ncbi:MAG: hypothetical protein Crog4KO_36120 [Crocinitomicaceae bacterium]